MCVKQFTCPCIVDLLTSALLRVMTRYSPLRVPRLPRPASVSLNALPSAFPPQFYIATSNTTTMVTTTTVKHDHAGHDHDGHHPNWDHDGHDHDGHDHEGRRQNLFRRQ